MSRHRSGTLICAIWLFACNAFGAQAWYSPISINSGQVPSTQSDFPVLVSQTDNRFKTTGNGGHVTSSSGFDIRPYSDTGLTTALSYELERYNGTTGEVVMWVKVGSLSSSTTPIYLGYGDSGLTTDGSSGANTFSNSFVGVAHMKDGSTLSVLNSVTGTNMTNNGTVTAATGNVDGAGGFVSASSQSLTQSLSSTVAFTMQAWVKATSFPNAYNAPVACSGTGYHVFFVKSTGKLAMYLDNASHVDISYDGTGATTLSTGTWYYLSMVYSSAVGLIGYVNTTQDKTVAANGNASTDNQFAIGKDPINAGRFWNGTLDEVRMSSVARSADWITTEYNNMNAPGTFETLGTEVAVTASQRGWFMFLKR